MFTFKTAHLPHTETRARLWDRIGRAFGAQERATPLHAPGGRLG